MQTSEAFIYVKNKRPNFVYISGKTSTGKTTFANKLKQELGYAVVELDTVITDAVIVPLELPHRGQAFFEMYKKRERLDWINLFVSKAHEILQAHKNEGSPVVIEGAVAHAVTLQELLAPFPETEILYFHPQNLETYQTYLTNRFMQTTATYHAGLPIAFWELINKSDFAQFCQDRVLTPALRTSIQDYALSSQHISKERLQDLQRHFKHILVVKV